MKDIIIQKAEQSDAAYITEKLGKYILDKTNATWDKFFVAKEKQKTVGFGRVVDHGDCFEIASLGVDYYHRKKGIAIKILLFLIEEAKRLDPKKSIYGVTHRPGLLAKVGFEEVQNGPEPLEHKKHHKCILPPEKIKIMKFIS